MKLKLWNYFHIQSEIVRLGEHEMGTRVESRQDIEIAKIEKHRGYDSLDGKYDIAILTLVRDVEFSGEYEWIKHSNSFNLNFNHFANRSY